MPGFIGIHLGAGYHSDKLWPEYRKLCKNVCKKCYAMLSSGATALETVTEAVAMLEDSPLTNAGTGSNLSWDGGIECDASVMDGKTLKFGAVGAIPNMKNPIKVAECICKRQMDGNLTFGRIPPCMLVGRGAREWAKLAGFSTLQTKELFADKPLSNHLRFKKELKKHFQTLDKLPSPLDTVGAVCLDKDGNVAAACSSGGLAMKTPGRVGQAAMYGCGAWATNATEEAAGIATCTSGCGEYLIQTMMAREVAMEVLKADTPATTIHMVMSNKFQKSPFLADTMKRDRNAGAIVLKYTPKDECGEFLWAHTTKTMCVAYMNDDERKPVARISRNTPDLKPGNAGKIVLEGVLFKVRPSGEIDNAMTS